MPAGYIPAWLPINAAVAHVAAVAKCAMEEARDALVAAILDGEVRTRFSTGEALTPEDWQRAKGIDYQTTGVFYFSNPEVEVRRVDLERLWSTKSDVEPTPSHQPARARPPSRLKPFWGEIETAIMSWLDDNGCPAAGDGGQAALERWVADRLEERSWEAGPSAIRRHVRACIERYRASTGA